MFDAVVLKITQQKASTHKPHLSAGKIKKRSNKPVNQLDFSFQNSVGKESLDFSLNLKNAATRLSLDLPSINISSNSALPKPDSLSLSSDFFQKDSAAIKAAVEDDFRAQVRRRQEEERKRLEEIDARQKLNEQKNSVLSLHNSIGSPFETSRRYIRYEKRRYNSYTDNLEDARSSLFDASDNLGKAASASSNREFYKGRARSYLINAHSYLAEAIENLNDFSDSAQAEEADKAAASREIDIIKGYLKRLDNLLGYCPGDS